MTPADNRVLDPADCEREPFASTNRALFALIEKEKREHGAQLSYIYPSKVWEYPWALTRHPLPAGELVLDAGCGTSTMPIYLASCGATVVAADNDARWLAMEGAAARFHGVPLVPVQLDMLDLRFPDATFDRVYCISVLEHVPRELQPRAVREMARVLRPGGVLYLTVDYDEHERRSDDDVVYDRLALQECAIAPSGLEVEGTTDYTRPDWPEHHQRMRAFKLHSFAAMAVTLRKPGAVGPESAEAIASRRAQIVDEGFVVGVNVGWFKGRYGHDLANNAGHPAWGTGFEREAIRAALRDVAELGFRRARIWLFEGGEGLLRDEGGVVQRLAPEFIDHFGALQDELRAAGLTGYLALLDANAVTRGEDPALLAMLAGESARDSFVQNALVPVLRAIDPAIVRAIDAINEPEACVAGPTGNGGAEGLGWADVHAFIRACAVATHAGHPTLLSSAGSGWRDHRSVLEGRFDGAALDFYDFHYYGAVEALPTAREVSMVRPTVLGEFHLDRENAANHQPDSLVRAIEAIRERGYAGAYLWRYGDRGGPESLVEAIGRYKPATAALRRVLRG